MKYHNHKKIGIITFHWGTNYGGVLQAFALQTFLRKENRDVEIINYAPLTFRDSFIKILAKNPKSTFSNIIMYFKECKFKKFRKKHLYLTNRYYSLKELKDSPPKMDVYICGSDQIWNPYIANNYGEPYFLDFGHKTVKRIAYAVSFGCSEYPDDIMKTKKNLIANFDSISVREQSGVTILNKNGFNDVRLLPDPTLLLDKMDFISILPQKPKNKDFYYFYILQENQKLIHRFFAKFKKEKNVEAINSESIKYSTMSIEDWLYHIKNAEFVVTNSFHGVVFSILFEKKFIAIPIEGKLNGMNDRLYTLLDRFRLRYRLLEEYDENKFNEILDTRINWEEISKIKEDIKLEALDYFNISLTC